MSMTKKATGTTDENGKVTFSVDDFHALNKYIFYDTDSSSGKLLAIDVRRAYQIDGISIQANMLFDPDKLISGVNQEVGFTATINSRDRQIDNYRIDFLQDNVLLKSGNTDANGVAKFIYKCTGKGTTKFTVKCGNWQQSMSIQDVIQYWNAKGSLNDEYNMLQGKLQKLASYYHLEQVTEHDGVTIALGDGETKITDDWIVQFDVIGATNTFYFLYGTWKYEGTNPNASYQIVSMSLKANDTVIISKTMDNLSLNVNGVEKGNFTVEDSFGSEYPAFGFLKSMGKGSYLNFNNLIFKRL